VDYPVQTNRWRTRALVLAAIAALELFVLVGVGVFAAGRVLAGEVATVARAHELAPTKKRVAPTEKNRPLLERTEVSVVVLNGNGIAGVAGETATRVRAKTYVVAKVGNAPRTYAKSMVMFRKGYQPEAERLAKEIGVKIVGPLDGLRKADLMGAHLAVVLGR
jgi:LytR cell envelope-related transcriptional attenuator